jgi:hypothetical protein
MKKINRITAEEIKALFKYDPETGKFHWLVDRKSFGGKAKIGAEVGSLQQNGYLLTRIKGVPFLLHRLAYLYVTGIFPEETIDHINHIRSDNRWSNLRLVSEIDNGKNVTLRSNNKSGHVGVSWDKTRGMWLAGLGISNGGKRRFISLGHYADKEDAIRARQQGSKLHDFHPNHGRPPSPQAFD